LTPDPDAIGPFNLPLTREQFSSALRKGQGRAFLHVKQCGVAGVEDLVLDACTHSLVLDALFEGTRGEWLFLLLEAAGLKEKARPAILRALQDSRPETTDSWTVSQLMVLAVFFAREGDEEFRRALYAKFALQEYPESSVGGHQIICLDGLAGMLHVAEVIGARILREPDYRESDYLLWAAGEDFGRETVLAALKERAGTDERVRAYVSGLERSRRAEEQGPPQERKGFDHVLEMIEHWDDRSHAWLSVWAKQACEEEIAVIVSRMERESRAPQLRGYLRLFRWREVPGLPARLFDLTESADEWVRKGAFWALGNSCDARVRDWAIRLLQRTPPCLGALRLFERNYQPGDYILMESVLPNAGEAEALHDIALDLKHVAGEVKNLQLAGCLLWVCEYSPCSFCRQGAVEKLVDLKVAPRTVLEECLYDCQDETRDLAKAALGVVGEKGV